jgi:hypothetical protein
MDVVYRGSALRGREGARIRTPWSQTSVPWPRTSARPQSVATRGGLEVHKQRAPRTPGADPHRAVADKKSVDPHAVGAKVRGSAVHGREEKPIRASRSRRIASTRRGREGARIPALWLQRIRAPQPQSAQVRVPLPGKRFEKDTRIHVPCPSKSGIHT